MRAAVADQPAVAVVSDGRMKIEKLFESPGLPAFGIPPALAASYGGDLGFPARCVFANLVESIDGVVAVRGAGESGAVISGHSEADRFIMGLLRACAGAVLIGAGTLRAAPEDLWYPDHVYPDAAPLYAQLRQRLGLLQRPQLFVLSGAGSVDESHPALQDGGIVVTTRRGAGRLGGARTLIIDEDPITPDTLLRELGHARVLAEGGPTLIARLISAGLLEQLFVTVSPLVFGRYSGDGRKALTHGIDLRGARFDLLSARRHESHLFLRYGKPA